MLSAVPAAMDARQNRLTSIVWSTVWKRRGPRPRIETKSKIWEVPIVSLKCMRLPIVTTAPKAIGSPCNVPLLGGGFSCLLVIFLSLSCWMDDSNKKVVTLGCGAIANEARNPPCEGDDTLSLAQLSNRRLGRVSVFPRRRVPVL